MQRFEVIDRQLVLVPVDLSLEFKYFAEIQELVYKLKENIAVLQKNIDQVGLDVLQTKYAKAYNRLISEIEKDFPTFVFHTALYDLWFQDGDDLDKDLFRIYLEEQIFSKYKVVFDVAKKAATQQFDFKAVWKSLPCSFYSEVQEEYMKYWKYLKETSENHGEEWSSLSKHCAKVFMSV